MILTRAEFTKLWNMKSPSLMLGDETSVLWVQERNLGISANWFIKVKPIRVTPEFHEWSAQTLAGNILCYSSSEENAEEWWGFTDYKDILIWKLKWEGQ